MRIKAGVYREAIKHLISHDERTERQKSPYSCDCIGYVVDNLGLSRSVYSEFYRSYFNHEQSEYYQYFGWFDKSSPKQAKLEREIALELMYWIAKDETE